MQVVWKGKVIATSHSTIELDGYHYFRPVSVRMKYLKESTFSTTCPSKGKAQYWDIEVDGERLRNVAFSYPKAINGGDFEGRIAFWLQPTVKDGIQIIQ